MQRMRCHVSSIDLCEHFQVGKTNHEIAESARSVALRPARAVPEQMYDCRQNIALPKPL